MEDKSTTTYVVLNLLSNAVSRPVLLAARATKQLARWQQVRRDRAVLASLSDECLRDIGLSRADVRQATRRPLRDDPLRR